MLHKGYRQDQNIEFKEEQRKPLCSNNGSDRCSSLDINRVEESIDVSIDRLASILVEAYLEKRKREPRKNNN